MCVSGDGGAWPVQGLLRHFRYEIERRIDAIRNRPACSIWCPRRQSDGKAPMMNIASQTLTTISLSVSLGALFLSIFSIVLNFWMARSQRAISFVGKYVELEAGWSKGADKWDMRLSFVLLMAQEVLRAYPLSRRWRKLMKDQLAPYRSDLITWEKQEKGYFKYYGRRVAGLVYEIIEKEQK